jgi:glycosyltransferase involved in cell wall biosynthesis
MSGRPIRVMNVIARLNVGGPAIHVSLITQHLNAPIDPRYESLLVAGAVGQNEGDMSYYAAERGVTPVIIPSLGRELHPLRDLATLVRLVRLMRRQRPDIVNTHTAKAGFVGRVAARLAGVPVVVHTFHGHVFHGYFSPLKTSLFIVLEKLAARLADRIIVLTDGQRGELADMYRIAPREKFVVMPLGLELDALLVRPRKTGDMRRAWDIPPDAPLITIVGRLVPVKNHALFLRAARLVRDKLPGARFLVVGDGELRAALEAQAAALGLGDAVRFTGWQRDVAAFYADSDALVISSVNEGTPLTVIEALACGTPVVATAVGGLPDLLMNGDLGALVPSEDADALAAAVLRTLDSPPESDRLRVAARTHFSIDRLARDLDTLYTSLG